MTPAGESGRSHRLQAKLCLNLRHAIRIQSFMGVH
jgi:hypothetical protein